MSITLKDIPTIREALKKQKPIAVKPDENRPLTTREIIQELAPTLVKMKANGFTNAELMEFLAEHKIEVKSYTLSRYLRKHQDSIDKPKVEQKDPTAQPPSPDEAQSPAAGAKFSATDAELKSRFRRDEDNRLI